ncbi:4-amino-4-deoxy-L-arabinose transferase [Amycolatopsis pretoriensis]|uniref:4-amino-4-deoxy-L-arabinose transferase n=1 Tax=Amycolatopsis pretoriensis TaxID=218821 RepID=A0A1H5R2Z4_9PSEU|nr:glycosyltransferase family 39 protein [Amycolatopsis pretoriensis]SEF31941.1 4-amino-4-deoxy-L-arabinose transferase [Amycolatopsis pretoriensis]
MDAVATAPDQAKAALAPFARLPVALLALGTATALLLTAGRYGYFGDELYFLAAGKHLAWGYADQPPLVPFLAWAMDSLAPGSLVVFRLPAIAATAAGVVVTALIARELGGRRKAQARAAAAYAICGQFVGTGHYLATSTIDPLLWTLVLWLVVRWVRTRDDTLLVWLGVVTAVALNDKLLIGAFWVVAGLAVLAFGPRELLRRPKLWLGALIAAGSLVPTLLWQRANGWPQLGMGDAVGAEVDAAGGRGSFVPQLLAGAGWVIGALGVVYGIAVLLGSKRLRPYRFLGWTALGVVAVFLVANGRYYYAAGMFGVLWAAAAVHFEALEPSRWWRWVPTWPVFVLSALFSLPFTLPLWPAHWLVDHPAAPRPAYAAEEIGWPDLADDVAKLYRTSPPGTAVVTGGYWQAGALGRYGPERGLPEAYSPSRGFWYFGRPADNADTVLFVGYDPSKLAKYFGNAHIVGQVGNRLGVRNASEHMPVWQLTGRTAGWAEIWPRLKDMRA